MVGFIKVLDDLEERSRRLDDAPPPPTVSFVEPPEPVASQPRAAVSRVAAAYQKMQSPLLPEEDPVSSADDLGDERNE